MCGYEASCQAASVPDEGRSWGMGQAVSPRQQLQGLLMEFVSVSVFPSHVVRYLGLSFPHSWFIQVQYPSMPCPSYPDAQHLIKTIISAVQQCFLCVTCLTNTWIWTTSCSLYVYFKSSSEAQNTSISPIYYLHLCQSWNTGCRSLLNNPE